MAFSRFWFELIGCGYCGISEELLQLCSLSWLSLAMALTWSGLLTEATEPLLFAKSVKICYSLRHEAGGLASLGMLLLMALIYV